MGKKCLYELCFLPAPPPLSFCLPLSLNPLVLPPASNSINISHCAPGLHYTNYYIQFTHRNKQLCSEVLHNHSKQKKVGLTRAPAIARQPSDLHLHGENHTSGRRRRLPPLVSDKAEMFWVRSHTSPYCSDVRHIPQHAGANLVFICSHLCGAQLRHSLRAKPSPGARWLYSHTKKVCACVSEEHNTCANLSN